MFIRDLLNKIDVYITLPFYFVHLILSFIIFISYNSKCGFALSSVCEHNRCYSFAADIIDCEMREQSEQLIVTQGKKQVIEREESS